MATDRRKFLKTAMYGTAATPLAFTNQVGKALNKYDLLDQALQKPVFRTSYFSAPVIIDTLELIRYEANFICRVRSKDGAEGIAVSNNMQMQSLYPIFINRLKPFFLGKDASNLEQLLDEVYVFKSNYKLQSLALWVPLATIEFAMLDLLGRIAGQPIGRLIGEIHRSEIAVYRANNYRGQSAEASIDRIKQNVDETKAKALKFKIGGRMSQNKDFPPGRTEQLIPMVRKTFSDGMTIYADSNGSYDAKEAIRIGKILQENAIDFYEEPTPFDWYEDTKEVAKALEIPIAGGEQEPSMRNFRWLIGNDALDIVQPDLFYFGGMIRSMKVARMAAVKGKVCVPHISSSGLGYLYMMHFVSALENAGPFHEFKGFNQQIPLMCATSELKSKDGNIKVPTGPGSGVDIDPDYIKKHKQV